MISSFMHNAAAAPLPDEMSCRSDSRPAVISGSSTESVVGGGLISESRILFEKMGECGMQIRMAARLFASELMETSFKWIESPSENACAWKETVLTRGLASPAAFSKCGALE